MEEKWNVSVKKVLEDCKPFLYANLDMLDKVQLSRGTNSAMMEPPEYRPKRTRRKVHGRTALHALYEMSNGAIKNRKEIVSCVGNVNATTRMHYRSFYCVLPIGSNYKMVWVPDIKDFNYNTLFDSFDLDQMLDSNYNVIAAGITNFKYNANTEKNRKLGRYFSKIGDYLSGFIDKDISDEKIHAFKGYIEDFKKYESELHGLSDKFSFEDTILYTNKLLEYMGQYIQREKVSTKRLDSSMFNAEIALIPENGFYYVTYDLLERLIMKYKKQS